MARKKLLAAAIGMLMPMAAEALTLGYIKVGSLLDQPLKAAIEVTAANPSELESLQVGLAPAAKFAERGIPRSAMLDNLNFQVVRREANKALIVVTSRTAVREPFVDFLLDARWSDGQVTREYTLLLDPPLTANRRPPAIDIPAAPPAPVARTDTRAPAPAAKKPPVAAAAPPAPARPASPPAEGDIRVNRGDTLWGIATRTKPQGADVYQTMNALYRENPSAFGGNLNNLMEGSILRVPPAEEIRALDRQASQRMLAEHTRAWQAGTPVTADAGTSPAVASDQPVDAAPAPAEPPDEEVTDATLRLASAGEAATPAISGNGGGDETSGAGGGPGVTDDDLVLAREKAASAQQEVETSARAWWMLKNA